MQGRKEEGVVGIPWSLAISFGVLFGHHRNGANGTSSGERIFVCKPGCGMDLFILTKLLLIAQHKLTLFRIADTPHITVNEQARDPYFKIS